MTERVGSLSAPPFSLFRSQKPFRVADEVRKRKAAASKNLENAATPPTCWIAAVSAAEEIYHKEHIEHKETIGYNTYFREFTLPDHLSLPNLRRRNFVRRRELHYRYSFFLSGKVWKQRYKGKHKPESWDILSKQLISIF